MNTFYFCIFFQWTLELFLFLSWFNCVWHHAGGALLACPVIKPGVEEIKVLLPGSDEVNQPPGNTFICFDVFLLHLSVDVVLRQVSVVGVVWCPLCRVVYRRQDSESSSHPGHSECLSGITARCYILEAEIDSLAFPPRRFLCSSEAARWSAGQWEAAPVRPNTRSSPSTSPWPSALRWASTDVWTQLSWIYLRQYMHESHLSLDRRDVATNVVFDEACSFQIMFTVFL